MSRRYAVVSIGTNSTRALLADVAPEVPRIELARAIGTRIGEGLDARGELGEEPMARTCAAIEQLLRALHGRYVRLFAIATSALRRARNGEAFAARVAALTGVPLRVLSGEEEAQASYRGAITALGALDGTRVAVLDAGGGSSELAAGTGAHAERVVSCEIGAVRLTEAVPALDGTHGPVDEATLAQARALARAALAPMGALAPVTRLALVGGSATTTAAVVRGRRTPLEAFPLDRGALNAVLAQLCARDLEGRRAIPGIKAQRADILPAGIVVLDEALALLELNAAVATTSDLLLGTLLEARPAPSAPRFGRRPIPPHAS